jgi:hypothetical protein
MEVLEKVTIVAVRPSFLSGARRLESSKQSEARRKTVLQDVIDPKSLSDFNQMSTALFRLCRTYGSKLKLLDAWAVENSLAEELLQKLVQFETRFKQKTTAFIEAFPAMNQQWAARNPDEADAIRRLAYSSDELERGFHFAYAGFQLTAEQVQAAAGLDEELEGMSGQALKEFSDMIRDMGVKDPGKHVFTAAISGVLGQIQRKAASLAFLNPRIKEVATVLEGILKTLPVRGKIDDVQSIALRVVVDRIMNPAELAAKGFPRLMVQSEPAQAQPQPQAVAPVAKPKKASPSAARLDDSEWVEDDSSFEDDTRSIIADIAGDFRLPDDAGAW